MPKLKEEDILIPALKVIQKHPNCQAAVIQSELENEMVLSEEDLKPSLTRNGEPMYKQIVRNLIGSHFETNDFGKKYVTRRIIGPMQRTSNRYVYRLTEEGKNLLTRLELDGVVNFADENEDDYDVRRATPFDSERELKASNERNPELIPGQRENRRYKTDPKIAQTVLKKNEYKCEYARIAGEIHNTFVNSRNHKYVEAHHLIPMKAQKDFLPLNIDREENIVSLCPTCHRAVHFGNIIEKKKHLKPLYEAKIEKLRAKGIDITFEDLINKYYL